MRAPNVDEVRVLPAPPSCAFLTASLAFIADAPQIIVLEIPKLRNYENALTQGTGLLPFPKVGDLRGLPAPLSCVSAASAAFLADEPRIIFLEIPKLRNDENVLTQGTGLLPFPKSRRKWVAFLPHSAAFPWLRWLS